MCTHICAKSDKMCERSAFAEDLAETKSNPVNYFIFQKFHFELKNIILCTTSRVFSKKVFLLQAFARSVIGDILQ